MDAPGPKAGPPLVVRLLHLPKAGRAVKDIMSGWLACKFRTVSTLNPD